ncbi:hypothetical protein ABEB36_011186 [Hypothenemus hampei]
MPKKPKSKKPTETTKNTFKSPIRIDADNNILIEVYCKPGAKQNAVTDVSSEGISIQINAPPVEGSANIELIKYISAFLGLKSSSISLARGHKSRNKLLKVSGNITLKEVVTKFNADLPEANRIPECDS